MVTFVSPIGYDTRRVTRPVVHNGIGEGDTVVLLRPEAESDTERATQTIADVEQLLHEIEPTVEVVVERVPVEDVRETILACRECLRAANEPRIVSLGGGARDVLLPLLIAALADSQSVDSVLFFSDLDHSVREWPLPNMTARPPEKARETLGEILEAKKSVSLTELADQVDSSKSTVVRHVSELEERGLVLTTTEGKRKEVSPTFAAQLLE